MSHHLKGRVQIVGSGAIGSLIAAGAQRNNIPYSLAPRRPEQLTQRLTSYSGQRLLLADNLSQAEALGPTDLLVMPLKVHQLEDAARQWQDRLDQATPVLLVHNGMGGLESVRRHLPYQPVYQATTSHGVYKPTLEEARHSGFGRTIFGEAPDNVNLNDTQLQIVFETISRCLQPVTWHPDITEALWLKLVVNAVINPLTSLHDVPNGALAEHRFQPTIKHICQEMAALMQSEGMMFEPQLLADQVRHVIDATAQNYSSMHQDIKHRRRTEIDAINGFIVEQAQKKGIDVSVNAILYEKIKKMEAAYS